MSTQSLADDLLLIACGSRPGEMNGLLQQLLRKGSASRETIAAEARRIIGLLRLQAKSMEQMPPRNLDDTAAARLGLREWIRATRARAAELRDEANEFEQTAVAAGLLKTEEVQPKSGRGLLHGLEISEEDIEAAKRSAFRLTHDDD
jgi:hypothetical protein